MHRPSELNARPEGSGYPARPWVSAAISLLAWLFPALMAGASLDAPVGGDEIAHLQAACEDSILQSARPATLFYRAILPAGAEQLDASQLADVVPQARLGSLVAISIISGLLMVSMSLLRGRGVAVLACLALGCLPPIAVEGARIRPELPSTVFALLGMMFLVGMPDQLRRLRLLSSWLRSIALALVIGGSFAMAIATLPGYGIYLLVPGVAMGLAVLIQMTRFIRVLRRRGILRWPALALAGRIGPWVLAAFATLLMAAMLIPDAGSGELVSASGLGLMSERVWLHWPTLLIAFLGAAFLVLRLGLSLGRVNRLTGECLLLVYAAIMLLHRVNLPDTGIDALPAAPALAILLAEGGRLMVFFLAHMRR